LLRFGDGLLGFLKSDDGTLNPERPPDEEGREGA